MRQNKLIEKKGITLVALVVTVIVLIILAGVSISLILGENGIITKAEQAKENMELAQIEEETKLNELYMQIEGNGEGTEDTLTVYKVTFNGSNVTSNGSSTIKQNETYTATLTLTSGYKVSSIAVKMGGVTLENTGYTYTEGVLRVPNVTGNIEIEVTTEMRTVASEKTPEQEYYDEDTKLVDSDGNEVVIPEGFKIAEDSGDNVTEGIVIEDNDIIEGIGNNRGNQYVWIPVGEGIKKSDGTTVDIELGRYTFASNGAETLVQSADNYEDEIVIGTYYRELVTSRIGVESTGVNGSNTTALDLKGFIDSVEANGGYYIARYEASYGIDGKANSKISNNYSASIIPTTEGTLWNCISQINAATASREIYKTAKTDLINSYAWDTAIVYIQEFSNDIDYSGQVGNTINSSLTNTGVNGDEVCKINDMASNILEWTTEYSTSIYNGSEITPSTYRSGNWVNSESSASSRHSHYSNLVNGLSGFRTALYM